jgi:phosphate:Na+ symporter
MRYLYLLFSFLGAGALFAVGFRHYTDTMVQLFTVKIRTLLQRPVGISGIGSGIMAGVLSGGGTPVLIPLLGFIDSGRTSPKQASRIIPGVYLSVLIPVWLLYLFGYLLYLDALGLLLLITALVFRFNRKGLSIMAAGICTGLGLAFLGIGILNGFLQLIPYSRELGSAMAGFALSPLAPGALFICGILLVLLYRTPMAVYVLASSLSYRGWLPLSLCLAVVLGAHAGYPLIGLLTGRSFSLHTRRVTVAHTIQNSAGWVITAIIILNIFPYNLAVHRNPFYMALFTSLLYFVTFLSGLLISSLSLSVSRTLVSDTVSGKVEEEELRLIPDYIPESLDTNLLILRNALARIALLDHEMLMIVLNTSQETKVDSHASSTILERDARVSKLSSLVGKGLIKMVEQPCSPAQADTIGRQQTAVQELSKIADSCTKTMTLLERSYQKQYQFHEEAQSELFDFTTQVLDFLKYNSDFLHGDLKTPDWNLAGDMEDGIDKARNKLRKRARRYLEKDPEAHIRGELAFIEVLGHLEHIGDSCLAISRAIFGSCH